MNCLNSYNTCSLLTYIVLDRHVRSKAKYKGFVFICLTSLLMFVLVLYYSNTSLGCALCCFLELERLTKINKGISERLKKQSTKTKSFLFFKKGIIDKEERYRNRLKARLTLIANTRIEKSC